MSTSPPKRRWYQFSLLTLMVVMTVAILAFGGWVQYMRQRAMENRARVAAVEEAVAAIEELGGKVWRWDEKRRPQTWLVRQFDDPGGVDDPVVVSTIWDVSLAGTEVGDTSLAHLRVLTDLQILNLQNTNITDFGLWHLKGLNKLEALQLWNTKVTDEGVNKLQQALPNCTIQQ